MTQSIKVILRNPLDKNDLVDYTIVPNDTLLAKDWVEALSGILLTGNLIEKNFCFMGFPHTARNLSYLCKELNDAIYKINLFNRKGVWPSPYVIEEYFTPDVIRFGDEYPIGYDDSNLGLSIKHGSLNILHNHFERLQGTVWGLSDYYKLADYETKYAIRQLNNLCHEAENLVLSQRKQATTPQFARPSQITTFLQAQRYDLKAEHREGFITNGYDRVFGGVYMHWTQIGKTLFEVYRDENAPELTNTICEAINELRFYSGEFDVEWGRDVVMNGADCPWHTKQMNGFYAWLKTNNKDCNDPNLGLGYLPMGQINLRTSFGTTHPETIWQILSNHLDIYKIEIGNVSRTYDFCWTDLDYKQLQINMMKPGYDYSSRR